MKKLLQTMSIMMLSTGLFAQWSITGNAGTNPPTNFVGTTDAKDFVTKTNATERMRVLSSNGYVGLNQTAPAARLHVGTGYLTGITAGTFPEAAVSAPDGYHPQDGGHFAIVNSDTLTTDTNFVNKGGSMIMAGKDTRGSTHVAVYTRISGRKENNTSANYAGYLKFETRPAGASLAERIRITSTGDVGIGTSTPGYLLEVNGSAAKPGGGSWTATSDARLKQNVTPYKEGLAQVLAINPVRYRYNDKSGFDTKQEYVGVIAQELKKVAPYMVGSFEKNGEQYLNVDNSAMTYMLVNAIKELKGQADQDKATIATLQSQIDDLCKGGCASVTQPNGAANGNALMQNIPNPFSGSTVIGYAINSGSGGYLAVNALDGKLIRQVDLSKGQGSVTLSAGELSPGTYTYSLYVDGKAVDTKLMVISSAK